VTATATPPLPAIAWRQATWPTGFDPQQWGLAISPVDGRDLWLCAPTAADGVAIWASRDAASTWLRVGRLLVSPPAPGSCSLEADQGSASTLAAVLTWGSGAAGTLRSTSLISRDSGAHWRGLPGAVKVGEVGTVSGLMYALLADTAAPTAPPPALVVSRDRRHTWQPISPPGLAAHDAIFQFWLGHAASDVVAASVHNTLWSSHTAGASWSPVPTPPMQTGLGSWLPKTGHWLFCGWPGALVCSADQGQSWQAQPTLHYTLQCLSCSKGGSASSSSQACLPSRIAADGSLLADCPTNGSAPTGPGLTAAAFTLYRLAPHATAWTTLGAASAPWLTWSASGQLWCWDPQGGRLFVAQMAL